MSEGVAVDPIAALFWARQTPTKKRRAIECPFDIRHHEVYPAEADATTVVQNLLYGRYGQPLRVVALNVDEGWSQDVSEAMARKVREIAEREDYELTEGTLQFLEAHSPRVVQPTLPLW